MASGKSLEMRYIFPIERPFHDSINGAYVNKNKDRTLAGKKRIRQRKLTQRAR